MSIKDQPHFEIRSEELAEWIERQGADRWWTVDGDPLLAGRITFPCPGDELATELRRINRPLLVRDKQRRPDANGQEIKSDQVDDLVDRMENNVRVTGDKKPSWLKDRLLYLCWKGSQIEWLLVEDEETTEKSQLDLAQANKQG